MLRRGHWSAPVSALLAGTLVSNLLTSRRIDLMHFPGWILCKATKPGVSFSVYFFCVPVSFSLLIHICFVCSTASLMCKVTGWGDVCQKTKRVFFLYHKTMSIFMLHWRNFGHHFQCDWWPIQLSRYQFFYIYILYDAFLYHGGILFYKWNTIALLWFLEIAHSKVIPSNNHMNFLVGTRTNCNIISGIVTLSTDTVLL